MNIIVDDIGAVVEAMKTDATLIAALTSGLPTLSDKGYAAGMPFYLYGHRQEIADVLKEKGQDSVFKYQKYPLVALRLDTSERWEGGKILFTLNLALIMRTEKGYRAPERYDDVFKPVLYPMLESFFKQLKNVGKFSWVGDQQFPPCTKADRPYWGTPGAEGNTDLIFNDPLDAIELLDLQISQNHKC